MYVCVRVRVSVRKTLMRKEKMGKEKRKTSENINLFIQINTQTDRQIDRQTDRQTQIIH